MRPPLEKMFVRSGKGDRTYAGTLGVKSLLNSPAGGSFGMVRNGGTKAHRGWDIYADVNTPVYAISDGVIVRAERSTSFGRHVMLQFSCGTDTLYAFYAHLCHIRVGVGQAVKEGEILGNAGTDGNAAGCPPHLHFEIRTDPDGGQINPGRVLGGHYHL